MSASLQQYLRQSVTKSNVKESEDKLFIIIGTSFYLNPAKNFDILDILSKWETSSFFTLQIL